MAGTKKVKAKGAGKAKERGKPAAKDPSDQQGVKAPPNAQQATQLSNPERVERVKQLWQQKTQEERVQLLTVAYEDVVKYARDADEPIRAGGAAPGAIAGTEVEEEIQPVSYEEVLTGGMERKRKTGTWKEWAWPAVEQTFTSQEDFRAFLVKMVYPTALQKFLPKEQEPRAPEPPAEAALRKRMAELWKDVNEKLRVFQEQVQEGSVRLIPAKHGQHKRTRPTPEEIMEAQKQFHIDMIIQMMTGLSEEHELLYASVNHPIMLFICDSLPVEARETRQQGELFFEDLQKLPWEDVVQVSEWLLEKVDGLAAQWKDNREEDPEDNAHLADVDLFAITDDDKALQVHPIWLQHLQERVMGEDGNPHKSTEEEDPGKVGLVLEWVYGCIVSTAEKARENAKRHLHPMHPPDATSAWQLLHAALKEQQNHEDSRHQATELLREMLASRQKAHELTERFQLDKKPVASKPSNNGTGDTADHPCLYSEAEFPNWVIVELLEREKLLTSAKLHVLKLNLEQGLRTVRLQRYRQRQGEPVFERLKKQLEDVKSAHRGLDGSYRSTAEMDRQRQVIADQAIEEQLHAQTAFRQQGAHLQAVVNKLHAQEMDNRKLDQEMKQLHSWKQTIASVIHRLQEHINTVAAERNNCPDPDSLDLMDRVADPIDKRILRLRNQFFEEMRKQLYSEEEDKHFYSEVQKGIKAVEARLEEGEVVISQLEQQLLNVACDDPGSTVGMILLLPMLCERLDALAQEHAAMMAARAEKELILLNEEQVKREQEEREKKQAKAKKAKERLKVGKDKNRAEREAKERADRSAAEDEAKRLAEAEQSEKAKKLEAIEAQRRQEEEMLERRRQELLNEEGGFWRARMEQERLEQTLLVVSVDDAKEPIIKSSRSSIDGGHSRREAARPSSTSRSGAPGGAREPMKNAGRGRRDFGRRLSRDPPAERERRPRDDTARGGGGRPYSGPREDDSARSGGGRPYSGPREDDFARGGRGHSGPREGPVPAPPHVPRKLAPEAAAPVKAPSASQAGAQVPAQVASAPETRASEGKAAQPSGAPVQPSATHAAPPAPSASERPANIPLGSVPQGHAAPQPGPGARVQTPTTGALAAPPPGAAPAQAAPPGSVPQPMQRPHMPSAVPAAAPLQAAVRPLSAPGMPVPTAALGPHPQPRAARPMYPHPLPHMHHVPLQPAAMEGPPGGARPAAPRPAMAVPMPSPAQLKVVLAVPNGAVDAAPRPNGAPQRPAGPSEGPAPGARPKGGPVIWTPPANHPSLQRPVLPQHPDARPQAMPGVPGAHPGSAAPDMPRQPAQPMAVHASGNVPGAPQPFRPPPGAALLQQPAPHGPAPLQPYPAGMLPPGMGAAASQAPVSVPAAPAAAHAAPAPGMSMPGAPADAVHHSTSYPPPNLNGATIYPPFPGAPLHMYPPGTLSSMPGNMLNGPHMMQPGMNALPPGMPMPALPMMFPPQPGSSGAPSMPFPVATLPPNAVAPSSPSHAAVGVLPQPQQPHMMPNPSTLMHMPLQMQFAMQQGLQRPASTSRQMKGLSAGAAAFIPFASRLDSASSARIGDRDRASSEASTCTTETPEKLASRDASVAPSDATAPPPDALASSRAASGAAAGPAAESAAKSPSAAPPAAPQEGPRRGAHAAPDVAANGASTLPAGPAGAEPGSRGAPAAAQPSKAARSRAPPPQQPRPISTPPPPKSSHDCAASNGVNGAGGRHGSSLAKLSHDHDERLRLVRRIGLINETGQYNCFLNVIVQALWHLPVFARGLMAMQPEELRGRECCAQEWKLLNALQKLFNAFHAAADMRSPGPPARDGTPTLSPEELRSALPDKLFKRFEMHDAGEVLHEMFQALHVAEVGNVDVDPMLPARALVDVPAHKPKAGTWAAKAASQGPKANGSTPLPAPSSFVHRIFGLQVQLPIPGKPLVGEQPGQQLFEVERYMKYFHHITTHCLVRDVQTATRAGAPLSWGALVKQATMESEAKNGAPMQLSQLLSRPAVLSLALVWDTAQANMESIGAVVDAMHGCRSLSLTDLFVGVAPPCEYRLRGIICYFRHHYNAMVFSEEEGWLLFDDSHIEKPGDWEAILRKMKGGLQPSILFYEAVPAESQ